MRKIYCQKPERKSTNNAWRISQARLARNKLESMNSLKSISRMLSTLKKRRSNLSQLKSLKSLISQIVSNNPKRLIKGRNLFRTLRNSFQRKSKMREMNLQEEIWDKFHMKWLRFSIQNQNSIIRTNRLRILIYFRRSKKILYHLRIKNQRMQS